MDSKCPLIFCCLTATIVFAGQINAALTVATENRITQTQAQQSFDNIPSGEISSPNFPSPYAANDDSTWTIQGDEHQRVQLTFQVFMLESSRNCQKDYVQFMSPIQGGEDLPNRFCGNMKPFTITSTTNTLIVVFHSDSDKQYPGFEATFQLVPASTDDSGAANQTPSTTDRVACDCGLREDRQRRIVGGKVASEGEYPWLAVLTTKGNPERAHCGAVLLCSRYLLTAAHCAVGKGKDYYDVVLGAYNLKNKTSTEMIIGTKNLIPHEGYYKPTEINDIALIELEKDVPFSAAIRPICLPPLNNNFTGDMAVVAGWGRMSYGGSLSDFPRDVILPVVTQAECKKSFANANANITDSMMCAGVLDGSIDACQGDSGGPLMWTDPSDKRMKVIGITSFGVKCATVGYYGVYTRVNHYEDWIRSKIGTGCPCL